MAVETADEFYSIMGVLTREMVEFGLIETAELVSSICNIEPFPYPQLESLREAYIYNIRPLNVSINQLKKSLLGLLNSGMNIIDEENLLWRFGMEENWMEDQFAVATFTINSAGNGGNKSNRTSPNRASPAISPSHAASNLMESILRQFQMATSTKGPKSNELKVSDALRPMTPTFGETSAAQSMSGKTSSLASDVKQRLKAEIDDLKKQYIKLKQRQLQAEFILKGQNPSEVPEQIVIDGMPINLKVPPTPTDQPVVTGTSRKTVPFSVGQLLADKPALIARNRGKKESMINQALPRTFFGQVFTGQGPSGGVGKGSRANSITSLVSSAFTGGSKQSKRRAGSDGSVPVNVGASTSLASVTISLNGTELLGKSPLLGACTVLTVQPPASETLNELVSSTPTPSLISPRTMTPHSSTSSASANSHREAFRGHTKSSSSSTSTELCDELMDTCAVMGTFEGDEDEEEEDAAATDAEMAQLNVDSSFPKLYTRRWSAFAEETRASHYEGDDESSLKNGLGEPLSSEDEDEIIQALLESHSSPEPEGNGPGSLAKEASLEESCSPFDEVFARASFSSIASSTLTSGSSGGERDDVPAVDEEKVALCIDDSLTGSVISCENRETDPEGLPEESKDDLDECIRRFQYQIMRIKLEQSIN